METKVSFAIVGGFVLALGVAAIAGALWLASGRLSREQVDTYSARFTDSVSGLNPQAPVKYRGVVVGKVREIALDPGDPERVRLLLDIARGTPVKVDTVATIGMQGLTGIAYVELGGGTRDAPPLRAGPGEPYPVIATRPSLITRLDTAATALLGELERTSQRVGSLLDDDTRDAFRRTVVDLSTVVHALSRRSGDLEAGIAGAARTLEHTARASADLPALVERLGRSADAVERMATEMAQAGAAARVAFEGTRGAVDGVRQLAGGSLPDLQALVGEMRDTTASLGRVARELERNPGVLLLGRAPAAPGPGE